MNVDDKEQLHEYLGAICEVMTEDNRLLFVGIIQDYDSGASEVKIQLHKGSATPQGIVHRTAVKIRLLTMAQAGEQVALLYGAVVRCAPEFWKIEVQNGIFCSERRQGFRQPLTGMALIKREDGPTGPRPCQLVDISLRGVGFLSREDLVQGERIVLDKVQLRQGEEDYTFYCEVCRIQPGKGPADQTLYGCSFYDMSQRQEDRLCQAIFALQAQSLNRRRISR